MVERGIVGGYLCLLHAKTHKDCDKSYDLGESESVFVETVKEAKPFCVV